MTESDAIASSVLDQVREEEQKLEPVLEQPIVKEEEVKEEIPVEQPNEQEEEKTEAPSNSNSPGLNREPVFKRYDVGNF